MKVFFSVIGKDPVEVDTGDVLAFIAAQRKLRSGALDYRSPADYETDHELTAQVA